MTNKMKSYITTILLVLLIPLVSYAQNENKIITINKTDTLSSNKLKSLNLSGIRGMKVTINGDSNTHSIIYQLNIKANKRAIENNFGNGKLSFKKNNGTGSLAFEQGEGSQNSGDNITWIKALLTRHRNDNDAIIKQASISLTIPSYLHLTLHSRYSNITITSIKGRVKLEGRSGKVMANNLGSDVSIDNNYSNINLNNIAGIVNIIGKSATLNLQNIGNNISINADYSNIDLNQVKGNVTVQDKSGNLHLSNISGNITQRGDYSSLYLTDITGNVDIETKSGSVNATDIGSLRMIGDYTNVNTQSVNNKEGVTIKGNSAKYDLSFVKGPVSVSAKYANIGLKNISGDVTIDNNSGSVNGKQIQGRFTGNGDYNQYKLENYLGQDIAIHNNSGNITIGAQNQLHSVKISNQNGNVDLTLMKPFKGKVHLQVISGSINTNLNLKTVKVDNSSDEKLMEGKLGNSQASINISSQNGKITINQKQP